MKWKKLTEETVYDGYRKIKRCTFQAPDGHEADFDIKDECDTVCVLGLTKDNEVILAKQYRWGPERLMCELPGGGIDNGEDPKAAAEREFFEETGHRGEFEFIGTCHTCAYSPRKTHMFVALNCERVDKPKLDADEIIEVVLMNMSDFRVHLQSGELTDAATAYRALDYLNLLK